MWSTFRSLRIRNYRYFLLGGVVSNVGTWMLRVAQDWLILQLTSASALALGVTTGMQFLPLLLFSMVGGMLADRYPKRLVLAFATILQGLIGLTFAVLVLAGVIRPWQVYLLTFLFGVATSVELPARQSFVVEMVGREDLLNAVGLNSTSFNVARVIGPATAGLLIAAFDNNTGPVFLLYAVSTLGILAALAAMRPAELGAAPRTRRYPGQLREALRYVAGRPDLVLLFVIVGFAGLFGLNFQMMIALMATGVFDKGAAELGILGSVMALGCVSGALMAARRGVPRLRLLVGAAVVFGSLVVAAGLMPNYVTFAVILVPLGFAALTLLTTANALVQMSVEPHMRGRLMGLYVVVLFSGTPLGGPLVGAAAEAFGPRVGLIMGGAVSIGATVVAALLVARRQRLQLTFSLRPRPRLVIFARTRGDVASRKQARLGEPPAPASVVEPDPSGS